MKQQTDHDEIPCSLRKGTSASKPASAGLKLIFCTGGQL